MGNKMMSWKIAILLMLLSVISRGAFAEQKEWYSFLQNKGWYPAEGGSISSNSSPSSMSGQDSSLVQPSSQPTTGSTTPDTTTQSQTSNQPGKSSWFK